MSLAIVGNLVFLGFPFPTYLAFKCQPRTQKTTLVPSGEYKNELSGGVIDSALPCSVPVTMTDNMLT